VVADALSRKSVPPPPPAAVWLVTDFEWMGIPYRLAGVANEETQLIFQSTIPDRVREAQQSDYKKCKHTFYKEELENSP
jgi:hypothetical protein